MMDDWENDTRATKARVIANVEEDEDEVVKENWFDDDEEEGSTAEPAAPTVSATAKPKKKKLADKLAEKERLELEAKLAKSHIKSPEEIAAEKLRLEKLKEEAEIRGIQDAFGSTEVNSLDPQTKDDFDELRKRLVGDLGRLEKRTLFPDFVEDLIQDLCLYLPSRRLKKVKTSVEALYFEKSKNEKAATGKTTKSSAVKGKVKLNVEGDRAMLNAYDDVDDFEDFM